MINEKKNPLIKVLVSGRDKIACTSDSLFVKGISRNISATPLR